MDRIALKLGENVLGWVYFIIPSEDPGSASDYTEPVGVYIPNNTKK